MQSQITYTGTISTPLVSVWVTVLGWIKRWEANSSDSFNRGLPRRAGNSPAYLCWVTEWFSYTQCRNKTNLLAHPMEDDWTEGGGKSHKITCPLTCTYSHNLHPINKLWLLPGGIFTQIKWLSARLVHKVFLLPFIYHLFSYFSGALMGLYPEAPFLYWVYKIDLLDQ